MLFHEPKDLLDNEPSVGGSFEGMLVANGVDQLVLRAENIIALVQDIANMSFKELLEFQKTWSPEPGGLTGLNPRR